MTADEVKIAAATSFHRFCRQQNLDPSAVSEPTKMAWQAAFVEGAHWMKERFTDAEIKARQQMHEDAMRSLKDDARGG
jgi:hypothetical protein